MTLRDEVTYGTSLEIHGVLNWLHVLGAMNPFDETCGGA
jgi:hypothetical protein